jgi:[acyl-carrier-protein] S-malonyltransferase
MSGGPDRIAVIFGPSSSSHDMADMRAFHAADDYVREAFERVSAWSAIAVPVLLHEAEPPAGIPLMRVNSLALSAGMLGIYQRLQDSGIHPDVVGGISLGETMSACVAGALTPEQLVGVFTTVDETPASPEPGREEDMAFVFVPADQDPHRYDDIDGIYPAVDYGMARGGRVRLLALSGYRQALLELAATDRNPINVQQPEHSTSAHHTRLREHARRSLAGYLDNVPVADPVIPVCSCIAGAPPATTASEVRQLLLRNQVEPLSIPALIAAVAGFRPARTLVIGPFMRDVGLAYPFEVSYLDSPAAVTEAIKQCAG